MTKDIQNITKSSLGKLEADFIAKIGSRTIFSIEEARQVPGDGKTDPTYQKGSLYSDSPFFRRRTKSSNTRVPFGNGTCEACSDRLLDCPESSWHDRTDSTNGYFVATNHPVRHPPNEIFGIPFKIVALRPARFFGIINNWIDERQFKITDKEKTITDGLDLPRYVGGVGEIVKALTIHWKELDETKLHHYAAKMGNSAVVKRLGFLMESLGFGEPEVLRRETPLSSGFSPLDPILPKRGKYNRRWRLLINSEVGR